MKSPQKKKNIFQEEVITNFYHMSTAKTNEQDYKATWVQSLLSVMIERYKYHFLSTYLNISSNAILNNVPIMWEHWLHHGLFLQTGSLWNAESPGNVKLRISGLSQYKAVVLPV